MLERRHAGFLRLLVLAADIDLAGGIAADQHHREPRRQPVPTLVYAPPLRRREREAPSNAFPIDDPGRHLHPSYSAGFARPSFRKASPSFAGSPSTAICLRREVAPDSIRTLALGTPSAFANSSVTRAIGFAAVGDGADPHLDHRAAVGELLQPVDIVAAAARGHPQRDTDAFRGSAPGIMPAIRRRRDRCNR